MLALVPVDASLDFRCRRFCFYLRPIRVQNFNAEYAIEKIQRCFLGKFGAEFSKKRHSAMIFENSARILGSVRSKFSADVFRAIQRELWDYCADCSRKENAMCVGGLQQIVLGNPPSQKSRRLPIGPDCKFFQITPITFFSDRTD